ncbi:MAG: acetylornithine transaminase [Armatimonadota bacterium]|nr:MAG: acetylornithine transaminase [Armatimonadota bacterium]
MNTDEARQLERSYLLNLYPPIRMPMVIARGEGARLWDSDGKEYLDFVSGGRAVTGLGHCHPKVAAAIRRQAEDLVHVSNDFYTEPQLRLAERLSQLFGGRCFFCNSGAEAVETAIKLVRKQGYKTSGADKHEIVTALRSFHGRTFGALAATGQPKYHKGFQPLPSGFVHVPFNDVEALHGAVSVRTCAVLLEPILGESGVYPATSEFLRAARELCDRNGAALILDEVQTGLGRTGKMFAYQHYDVEPDVITLAKALGGGVPVGAIIAREPVASAFEPGDHASTFGGGPLPAAAALAALEVIEEEGLVENAAQVGEHLAQGLRAVQEKTSLVTEIRARGLMIAVDLAAPVAGRVKQECTARGLLINTVGDQMLRLIPPLVLSVEQAESGLEVLGEVLASVATE